MRTAFIYKAIFCVAALIIADRIVYYVMGYAAHHQRKGYIYELHYQLFETNADIVLIGSSRAKYHYNPAIIAKATGEKTVNLGQGSSNIFLHYIILKTMLLHHTPKMVVLDVKPGDFREQAYANEISRLYPIIDEMPLSDEDYNTIGPFEKIKLLCAAYKYNNNIIELLYSARGKRLDKAAINGFQPLPAANVPLANIPHYDTVYHQEIYKYLPLFVQLCRQKHIKLIVCTSPFYPTVLFDRTISETAKLCRQDSVVYINYLNNSLLNFPADLYKDEAHLNAKGADIFSEDFARRIK